MGVDYYNCGICEEIFSDAGYHGYCVNCEGMMCGRCHDKMTDKYGNLEDTDDERADWYGEEATKMCDTCANPKPTLDNKKFEAFMYFLVKDAAKYSFSEFLEGAELAEDDYEGIKQYLEDTYGIKMYL